MQVGTLVKINPSSNVWTSSDAILKVIEDIRPEVQKFGWITTEVVSGEVYNVRWEVTFLEGECVVGNPNLDFVELTDAEREEI